MEEETEQEQLLKNMATPVHQQVTDEYMRSVQIYLRSTQFSLLRALPNIGKQK